MPEAIKRQTEEEERPLPSAESEDSSPSPPCVLVVDDDARMRESLAVLLMAQGYRCEQVGSAEEALDLLDRREIDVLLLDIQMPGMSGMDLLERLSQRPSSPPAIMISSESTFENAANALRKGAADFMRKPYEPAELFNALERVLRARRLERALEQMYRELQLSEERHRFIIDNSPDIIYMLDAEGRFTYLNERVSSVLGYRPDELIGQHFSVLLPKPDQQRMARVFAERRTGERATRELELSLVSRSGAKDGRLGQDNGRVVAELNAMGIYVTSADGKPGQFMGTYGVLRDISARKRTEAMVQYQLSHDLLTGLPNRALFQDRLQQAIARARRDGRGFALMFIDMDHFKAINDSYGHLVGDALLQAVAGVMRRHVRDSDTLARIGGDEFMLLLPQIERVEDAELIAGKITEQFREPLSIEKHELAVGFSIGIAMYPWHGTTEDDLVRRADMAMYHVKRRSRRGHAVYEPSMEVAQPASPALEAELRKAMREGQLEVMLQPQHHTAGGRLAGLEALLRWHHPQRGLVLPADFIPCAEESRLIVELGEWVLEETCRLIRGPLAGLLSADGRVVSVNVSARQVLQPEFAARTLAILEKYGVPGHQIELEITENTLMQDLDLAIRQLGELSWAGIRIAMDDFGTGYSSLSYLQNLPLHTLKIDRSFVSGIRSLNERHSIVTGMIAMARELELDVVAEGVETEVQREFLQRADCPRIQGFLMGGPMPVQELLACHGY